MALGKAGKAAAGLATVFVVQTGAVDEVANDVGIGNGNKAEAAILTFSGTDLLSGQSAGFNFQTFDAAPDLNINPDPDVYDTANSISNVNGFVGAANFAQQGALTASLIEANVSDSTFKIDISEIFSGDVGGENVFGAKLFGSGPDGMFNILTFSPLSFYFTSAVANNAGNLDGLNIQLFGQENNLIANIAVDEMTINGEDPLSVPLAAVPVPAPLGLLATALCGMGAASRRGRNAIKNAFGFGGSGPAPSA